MVPQQLSPKTYLATATLREKSMKTNPFIRIPDSIDTLGPRGLKVVGRRLLRGSDVGNPHWSNATLLIGSTSSPHVGSTSGPHVITCRFHVGPTFTKLILFYFNCVVPVILFKFVGYCSTSSLKMLNVQYCTTEVPHHTMSVVCG